MTYYLGIQEGLARAIETASKHDSDPAVREVIVDLAARLADARRRGP